MPHLNSGYGSQPPSSKTSRHSPTSPDIFKIARSLSKIAFLFPTSVRMQHLTVKKGSSWLQFDDIVLSLNLEWLEKTMLFSFHNDASLLRIDGFPCFQNAKILIRGEIPFVKSDVLIDNMSVSVSTNKLSLDTDNAAIFLKNLRSKTSPDSESAAPIDTVPSSHSSVKISSILHKIRVLDISFSFDSLNISTKYSDFLLTGLFVRIDHKSPDDLELKDYASGDLHKLTLAVTTFEMAPRALLDTKVRAEFITIASVINIGETCRAFEKINDESLAKVFEDEEDSFLVRSVFTITEVSTTSTLDDLLTLLMAKPAKKTKTNEREKSCSSSILKANLLTLTRKIKVKFQILSSSLFLHLSDDIRLQLTVDDARVDSLTSEGPSLFESDCNYNAIKPLTFASRNIQLRAIEGTLKTKLLELDKFDLVVSISLENSMLYIDDVRIDANQIEILFEEIRIFKKLTKVAQTIDIDPERYHSSENSSSGILPVVKHFRIHIRRLRFAACFQNPVHFYNGVDQSDLNKFERGFSIQTRDICVSTTATAATFSLRELNCYLIRDFHSKRSLGRLPRIANLTKITSKYQFDSKTLCLTFPKIDMSISIEVVWSMLFAMKVIQGVIPRIKPSSKVVSDSVASKETSSKKLSLRIDLLMLKLCLPSDIDLALEVSSLITSENDGKFKAVRLYVTNPHSPKNWSPLVVLTRGVFKKPGDVIDVAFDSMRLEMPFEYVFYDTFDNARAFQKSLAQLRHNFKDLMRVDDNDKSFKVDIIPPSKVDKPLEFPNICIRAKELEFCMHDDPFEAKLTRCFLLGQIEQKLRIAKLSSFSKYEKAIQEKLQERYTSLIFERGIANKPKSDEVALKEYSLYLKDCHEFIELPKGRLLANLSESWIMRLANARNFNYEDDAHRMSDPLVRREFLEKYPLMVSGGIPPLFSLRISELSLKLGKPSFGLANYPEFLYQTGDKIPKDMEYGILVPVNVDLQCSDLEFQIKDYPLPLLAFGGSSTDTAKSIRICGDLAIIEQMYIPEEIRYNFVPFVTQYSNPNHTDNLYAFHISRTMTNIKFVTDLDVQVDSSRATVISWASAVQPALVYAMNSFDVFSKPPIDISLPTGFWDKIPLMLHCKWTFHCTNGIHLFIKAGQSPYDYIGNSAGFLFKWEDNVVLKINSTGKSEDFLIIESEKFEMAIPTFHISSPEQLIYSRSGSGREYSVRKTIIRLQNKPVTWRLGFSFERNRDSMTSGHAGFVPRSSEFKPHYLVRLKNPATFKNDSERRNHDSYEGWRSEYIHLAVSVSSACNNLSLETHNAAHLTPLSFSQFLRWWNTFHQGLGLPIKMGKLFDTTDMLSPRVKSPKFGAHLFSISYQLCVRPVYLAHLYRHTVDLRANSKISYTGIKSLVQGLLIDLHQSKTGVIGRNENNEDVIKELCLKMRKGIIDFENADLRIITAEFHETSAAGMLANEYGIKGNESSGRSSFDDFSTFSSSANSQDNSGNEWFDKDDFVELDVIPSAEDVPRWRMIPLASSPRFYYVRDLGKTMFEFPFDDVQSRTHDCQLTTRDFSEEAGNLAEARISELRQILNEKRSLKTHTDIVNGQIKDLEHRLVKLESLKEKFKEGVFPRRDEMENESIVETRQKSQNGASTENDGLFRCVSTTSSYLSTSIASTGNMKSDTASTYRNRFIVYKVDVLWDEKTKNRFLNYVDKVSGRRSLVFSMSHKAIRLADDLSAMDERGRRDLPPQTSDYESELQQSATLIENFDEILHGTKGISNAFVEDSYLLKFIFPQLRISGTDNSCLSAMSNEVIIKHSTVGSRGRSGADISIETRSGITISDAYMYVLEKEKALRNEYEFFTPNDRAWPPKLPFEMYYSSDALSDYTVIRNFTAGALIVKPNELHCSKEGGCDSKALKESVRIVAPTVHITANSRQYATILDCALSLIKFEKTESQKMRETVKNFVKFSETEDLNDIASRIQSLQQEARQLDRCKGILRISDSDIYKKNSTSINIQLEKIALTLNALVGYLQQTKSVKYQDSFDVRHLVFSAFSIELELLDDDGFTFLQLSAVDTYYGTTQRPDGASQNQVCIYDFIACDKTADAKYDTVISRFQRTEKPLCFVDWSLLAPVGGITVIEHRTIDMAPMRLQLDYMLAQKIYRFAFPKSCMEIGSKELLDGDNSESNVEDLFDDVSLTSTDSYSSDFVGSSASSSIFTQSTDDPGSVAHSFAMNKVNNNSNSSSSDNGGGKMHKSLSRILKRSKTRAVSTRSNSSFGECKNRLKLSKNKTGEEMHDDNMTEMQRRAKLYMLGNLITINPTSLCLTFKGKGKLKIINVTDMVLEIPKIELENRILSTEELLALFRIKVLRIALKNIPGFIQGKFRRNDGKNEGETTLSSVIKSVGSFADPDMVIAENHSHQHRKFLDPDLLEPEMEEPRRRNSKSHHISLKSLQMKD
ncbi:hypothetical protein FOA43_004097 [Brettanomyces nanus]|uniref:Uncharacterized protein n=1 Tax=Eeniella nana TaxID=13502 RepID=A0A875S6Y8_EENNA|nr:uncharacterized protein FOA43_004097 [Brettanomyces nanus]QPG76703.1 hypothetical protein FOA43_004097 [Brettanomyces nanus]